MKKLLAILLALGLLCCAGCGQTEPPAAPAEAAPEPAPAAEAADEPMPDTAPASEDLTEPAEIPLLEEPPLPAALRVPGDWYAMYQAVPLQLSVNEDGSFVLAVPGSAAEPQKGTWRVEDNFLWLGEDSEPLLVLDDSLFLASVGISFTREQATVYAPSEEFWDVESGDLDGYWVCRYVNSGGVLVPADVRGDDTVLYIEGENVALGGDFFGDLPLAFGFEDGGMIAAVGADTSVSLTIRLQQDGFLRLTLRDDYGDTVFFCAPASLPEE